MVCDFIYGPPWFLIFHFLNSVVFLDFPLTYLINSLEISFLFKDSNSLIFFGVSFDVPKLTYFSRLETCIILFY